MSAGPKVRRASKSVVAAPPAMGSRRLFFALAPGAAARASLHALALRHAGARGRPVPAGDLHLTLVFLGQVREDLLPRLCEAVAALRAAACAVRLERLERWRGGLLCATGPVPAPLQALHACLVGLARGCGIAVDARPLRAHVTLSRGFARRGPVEVASMAPVRWRSQAFCLMESRPRSGGARYGILKRWRLDSARNAAMRHE